MRFRRNLERIGEVMAIHNLSSSIQIYSSMDFRNNRSFAASDDLDAVSESLSELIDQIDDMLIWIEQHGSNTELVLPRASKAFPRDRPQVLRHWAVHA